MRSVVLKYIALSVLIIVGLGVNCQAETNTTTKSKVQKKGSKSDIDLPIIKLKVDKSTPNNPKLKKGKGCEDLEEAKGEVFVDYPMAKTEPCDKVDCKKLKPAKLNDYNYKELPTTQTDGSCEGDE